MYELDQKGRPVYDDLLVKVCADMTPGRSPPKNTQRSLEEISSEAATAGEDGLPARKKRSDAGGVHRARVSAGNHCFHPPAPEAAGKAGHALFDDRDVQEEDMVDSEALDLGNI